LGDINKKEVFLIWKAVATPPSAVRAKIERGTAGLECEPETPTSQKLLLGLGAL
jgi:hypothetical protein